MAWFRNLSLLSKLLSVVAILIGTAAFMGFEGVQGLRMMEQSVMRIDAASMRLEHAGRGTANLVQFVRMAEAMTRPLEPALRERVAAVAADEMKRFQSRMERLQPLLDTDEDFLDFQAMQAAINAYNSAYRQAQADAMKGDYAAAEKAIVAIAGEFNTARQKLRNIEDRYTKQLDQEQKGAIAAARETSQQLILIAVFGCLAGLALALAILLLGVTRPLLRMIEAMQHLAAGRLDATVPELRQTDEIGRIGSALAVFKRNAVEKQRVEAEIEAQRQVAEQQRAAREARERQAAAEVAELCRRITAGDLSTRLDESDKEGFLLVLSQELNRLSGTLGTVTGGLASVMQVMAQGDLTRQVEGDYQGVFATLKQSANSMAARLRDFAGRLLTTAEAVHGASAEISTGSQDLAGRTESQAASIEETAASMHEITATVRQNADNAQMASQLSQAASDTAQAGGRITADAVQAVTRIEESARRISDIVALIDEIAFQTNLLALNASVEAARAGEAGKGFAVVAQEVRALAQRSANASKDIKALISESNSQVKAGAGLVNRAGQSLVEIVAAIKKVSDIVAEIAAASREQTTGLDQINTAVASMDEMTQRNAALVEETTAAAQSLATQAGELANLVRFFKT
ncbi:methyl-accepting chemotaxis protein [Ferrovibrio sp.]|uniref:methyl-accepting chemotaxis protein n=1 Tax=Ferrovibrio sp. TaxID=1917215 RepID=UPI001B3D948B|nr:methyl-accepting chemotaxis protein [Ferrovibrio sp.]MBP7064636.1 HAMP domain-containing protein [Ferrovibrio sp.]